MLASQQVIQRIVALLVAKGTPSGSRVYADRLAPVSVFPTTKVMHVDEELGEDDDSEDITWPANRVHRLTVEVAVMCQAVVDIDAVMAEQASHVLRALEGDFAASSLQPLPGCAIRATGLRYTAPGEGQAAHGQAVVTFRVIFSTLSNDPDTLG